jgi:uncharacterized peroxidase-related enzyme
MQKENYMARLPIVDPSTSTGKAHDLLAAVGKKLGLVPNMTRVMANSPAVLEAYIGFSGALDGASLNAKIRERIALGTAEVNQCEYCLSAHSTIGKLVGLNEKEILDSRGGRSADSKAAAALQFSRQLVEKRGAVSEADMDAGRKGGLTEGEIAEVVALTALNIFTNYFNTAFQVDVDFPKVSPARRRVTTSEFGARTTRPGSSRLTS